MLILYVINLLTVLIFSIGALALIATLSFQERWKTIIGSVLSTVIMIAAILLSSRARTYKQDAEEFSKLLQETTFYLQKRNK